MLKCSNTPHIPIPPLSMDNIVDRNVTRLTQGPVGKALLALSMPIVLSNTLYTSHQLVNAFWVGRLGAGAVAAVSVSFPVVFLQSDSAFYGHRSRHL